MRRAIYLLLFLVFFLGGISFAIKNPQQVELQYYFGYAWAGPLSMLLLLVMAVGAVLGMLLSVGWVVKMRRQVSATNKAMRKVEREVSNLRALPIKDQL